MANQLEQLKKFTTVVADTGDFETMREYQPQDATTNPSLILKASQQEQYEHIVDKVIADLDHGSVGNDELVEAISDRILIAFGKEILDIVPGRVSTEVDARLSFDYAGTIDKARQLINLYEDAGIDRERILVKVASTWEGIQAASKLQDENINCNLTLMFSLPQAVACAEAGVKLISPFVGRIYDWYKNETGEEYTGADDPGVRSVQEIFTYFRKFGYDTEVMGASFRNTGQILELAGCDLLTIGTELLEELQNTDGEVEKKLDAEEAADSDIEKMTDLDETKFRFLLNEDAMATEKTAEGIRKFSADIVKMERLIEEKADKA